MLRDPKVLDAFEREMLKVALSPLATSAATLGTIGAGIGGVRNYMKAKEEGRSTGDAMGKALGGAVSGGLLGAGAAGITHAVSPSTTGSIARFGQRQVHGLTGWTPEGGIRAMRDGAYDAAERLTAAQKAMHEAHEGMGLLQAGKAIPAKHIHAGKTLEQIQAHMPEVQKELTKAHDSYEAMSRAEQMGLTSIPGTFKSIRQHGLLPTLSAGWNAQIKGTGPVEKALQIGLPAVGLASAIRSDAGPDEEGRGKAERVGEQVGQVVGNVAGGAIPIVGQMLVGEGAGRAGKAVGRLVDRFTGQPIPASQGDYPQ